MTTPESLERIEREARSAAKIYTSLAEACPYPFRSAEGRYFKSAFIVAREEWLKASQGIVTSIPE